MVDLVNNKIIKRYVTNLKMPKLINRCYSTTPHNPQHLSLNLAEYEASLYSALDPAWPFQFFSYSLFKVDIQTRHSNIVNYNILIKIKKIK